MIRAAAWRLVLVALLVGVLVLAGGCTLAIGWEPNRDPRWRYPDCSLVPPEGIVGIPNWLCPPPLPCNGETC